MKIRRALATLLLAAALPVAWAEEEVDVKPALAAAEAWLQLIDAGAYGDAWEATTPALQEAMPRVRWETTLEGTRGKFGVPIARKLRSATLTRGATPAHDYVVIEYDTRFDNRPVTREIVTPQRGGGGRWKVGNYIIR